MSGATLRGCSGMTTCAAVGPFIQCRCQRPLFVLFLLSAVLQVFPPLAWRVQWRVTPLPLPYQHSPSADLDLVPIVTFIFALHLFISLLPSAQQSSVTLLHLHQLLVLCSRMSSAGLSSGYICSSKHATIKSWQWADLQLVLKVRLKRLWSLSEYPCVIVLPSMKDRSSQQALKKVCSGGRFSRFTPGSNIV